VIDALAAFTDVAQWRFVLLQASKNVLFSIKASRKIDDNLGTPKVYIVDKKQNLRGRKLVKTQRRIQHFSPAELSNEMLDDFKVILYEYRAALKRTILSH
jgi:hypothetical protein